MRIPWGAMMNISKWIAITAGGLALAIFAGVILARQSGPSPHAYQSSESDLGAARNLDELVSWAKVVVVAELQSVSKEEVGLVSPVDGQVHSIRTDQVIRFKVLDPLKSDRSLDEELVVRSGFSTRSWEEDPARARTEQFGSVPFAPGNRYVLFLTKFSETTGDALGLAGPVAAARLDGDRLAFLISPELARTSDVQPPLLSASPALQEVRLAIAEPKPTATLPAVDPNAPALRFGAGIENLVQGLDAVSSRAELEALLKSNGLGVGDIDDEGVCNKVQLIVRSAGWDYDLGCQ